MDELSNIITLNDEEGNEVDFEFLDLIPYEGEEYVVLLADDDDELTILKVVPVDEETESYVGVDDEDTLIAVFNIFKEKFKDEFDFQDQ